MVFGHGLEAQFPGLESSIGFFKWKFCWHDTRYTSSVAPTWEDFHTPARAIIVFYWFVMSHPSISTIDISLNASGTRVYLHQNCNIASSNLLMNNYGVSQFLGPDPGDMYNPHLVEMQLVRQEWLKHDFRFTLRFSSCNTLKPFWESLLGSYAEAVKNQMVGHQSGQ